MSALAYGKLMEKNCRTPQMVYKQFSEWVRRLRPSLAPKKYIFVHFTKAMTMHKSACPVVMNIPRTHPSHFAHDLGVKLNNNLNCQPHLQHIILKLAINTNIYATLTASTWGTSIGVSRLLHTAIVRPAIITCLPACWATPTESVF